MILLLTKVQDAEDFIWYALAARENGWSRHQLPNLLDVQSDLARATPTNPYACDFLTSS